MKRFESNQSRIKQYRTGFVVLYILQELIVPFIYLLRIYDSIHVDQAYRKQYVRNIVKILLSLREADMYISKHINKKRNSVDENASRDFP